MKLSIIFTSALATMAIASPTTNERVVSRKSSSLLDTILDALSLPDFHPEIDKLHQCMSEHKTFQTDFTKEDDGMAYITNVHHTCCEMAMELYEWDDDYLPFRAVFTEPCHGVTVSGLSKWHMKSLKVFLDSMNP